ncbi:MAG: hypothetical protein ACRYG8_17050 [Janthinobacterium lividum]
MLYPMATITAMAGKPQPDEKSGPKPGVPYWHLWTDESGVSHQKQCSLEHSVSR